MSAGDVLDLIKSNDVKYVDLRFTDTKGKEQHVSVPAAAADEDFFEDGKMFDGSSIAGWKSINESDMILMPGLRARSSLPGQARRGLPQVHRRGRHRVLRSGERILRV